MSLLLLLIACSDPPPPPAALVADPVAPVAAPEPEPEPAPKADRPPALGTIALNPTTVQAGVPISVTASATDPEGQPVDLDYQWVINHRPHYELTADTLPGDEIHRGDLIEVDVSANDGVNTVTKRSPAVTVANTPPQITSDPTKFSSLDGYQVTATDVDRDKLTFRVEGAPAGMIIDEDGKLHYTGSETEPGGDYNVTVIVDDGHNGAARWSFQIGIQPGRAAGRERKGAK